MANITRMDDTHSCIPHQPQDKCQTPELDICRETGKANLLISTLLQPSLKHQTL